MSTVRLEGIYFRAYPGDHEPRHVHGEYGETVAIVDLRPDGIVVLANRVDKILPGNAKRSDVRKILKVAQEHFDSLVLLWNKMHR